MKRLILIFSIISLSTLFGCEQNKSKSLTQDSLKPIPMTKPVENIIATKNQLERRTKSEQFCKSKNIPIYTNPNSLFVASEENVTIRTKDEVLDRAIALCYLELKSENADKESLAIFDKKYNAMPKLTAKEKEFALADNPTEQQIANANWKAESYHVMLWALGYIDNLVYPSEICNIGDDVKLLFSKTEKEFRNNAKLRSKIEILNQADLILRLDWACVNARLKNEPSPGELDKDVVYERHYSFNWLTKFMNQAWDDVTTGT